MNPLSEYVAGENVEGEKEDSDEDVFQERYCNYISVATKLKSLTRPLPEESKLSIVRLTDERLKNEDDIVIYTQWIQQ
ncbi:hypothetical protein ACTXT7_012535 [Hymenolepis weldensis]